MSTVSRFAAAFGFKAKAADDKKEDDEQKAARRAKARERKDGESDEDYAKRCAEEDEKDKAEDEKDKKDAANPAAAAPAAHVAAAATVATARAEGVTAERKRWETVLSDPRAADRGITACHMLAGTDMDATVILSTLATLPAQAAAQESEADGLARRMAAAAAANPAPSVGADGGQSGDMSPTAVAARINAAADKARGVTK